MFVRLKRVNGHDYVYLVENVREGGRHVQRVIKSLGRRDQVEAAGLLDQLAISAGRHSRRTLVLSAFHKGELAPVRRESIGPDLIFGRLWEQTGCGPVLRCMATEHGFAFDLERAVYASVLHRLMVSGSDRHAEAWVRHCRVPGAEHLSLRQLYKAIAWLGAETADGRPRTELIEEALFAHRRELFGQVSIAFFDTTSLWFEGRGGSLGRHGHSKDYRPQSRQVILGIVLDGADRPLCSFLWPGNTVDVTRLVPVAERLRARFDADRVCLVADRGMISAEAIAALEAAGLDYLLGVRERSLREAGTVIEDDGAMVPLVLPRAKGGETQLKAKAVEVGGRRYIICRNEERAAEDAATRAAILDALARQLGRGDKALVGNAGFRRYLRSTAEGHAFAIDPERVAADARWDGVFVLRTNTRLHPLEAMTRYRNLAAVERTFELAKAELRTRPIFHRTDAAIRGHVFCSFLALVLRKELANRLAAQGRTPPEWNRLVTDLADLSTVEVEQDGRRAQLRTMPGPTIDPVCRALGLALPPVFQEMPPAPAAA
ncbi:MAG TPA: transposase [Nocardioidaceae bacterium]|nr:transposase [Nocardioidaceae bacterium]